MITNFQKYIQDLKKLEGEYALLQKQELALNVKRRELEEKIYEEAYDYLYDYFSKNLILKNNDKYFYLNDEIGISLFKSTSLGNPIKIRIFFNDNKKQLRWSAKVFHWIIYENVPIDKFADSVIKDLEKHYNQWKEQEIKRSAKKYNL